MGQKTKAHFTNGKSSEQSLRVDADNLKTHLAENPRCPHGPTLLFHRTLQKTGLQKSFYSCAAFRDKKRCKFHLECSPGVQKTGKRKVQEITERTEADRVDGDLGAPSRKSQKKSGAASKFEYDASLLPKDWCGHCQKLVPFERTAGHPHHLEKVDTRFPTRFLPAMEDNPAEAQYFFSERTKEFFIHFLQSQKAKNVICVGCPRLHEEILASSTSTSGLCSFLLDIDARFSTFFPRKSFAHYNMFNHYFFEPADRRAYLNFIREKEPDDVIIVMDPPFAGIVQVLANSLQCIFADIGGQCSLLWIFPYYMEKHISREAPYLRMISYKVEYANHGKMRDKSALTRGSPIRIFTNIQPELIQLPAQEGYWFCQPCRKFSSREERHCPQCGECAGKDGKVWRHCRKCKRCVKGDWQHCQRCQRCHDKVCINATSSGT
ncbi:rRNA N6-adenosine-methyltransferase ZCCHC4-like [Paramacrobiotus metropolitanus]|uniref:rRNA N6-adenosine-methyltransferase ZCCHC4-like n=1 Tax=Paramacrobiotus metropolitanus TaxID=2943436 RepID=UPI0024457328|nr:rRNA N6-adenosine-methyltransferase ZCCHC4-like [Paramacrobiotus metropolitanus]